MEVQRLKSKTGKQKQIYLDATLDESGWSPEALARLVDLGTRLPYEEAAVVAQRFGLDTSRFLLNDLSAACAGSCQNEVLKRLQGAEGKTDKVCGEARPQSMKSAGRVMVLQIDGVYVLGCPEAGSCPGLEIKSAVLYPQNSPGERWMLADRCSAETFLPLLAGLLTEAKLTPQDTLLGLGDGAAWIDTIFSYLGALRITDVYHATEYLDLVMQAMDWDEQTRAAHRRDWYRADTSARDWLKKHLPDPECWLTWDKAALAALRYLEKRLDSMDYPLYKARGYPVGSGQIEAVNKAVIGHRLKRSGMHWSKQGAAGMASLRAQTCAKHPLVDFDTLRFNAFSLAASSP